MRFATTHRFAVKEDIAAAYAWVVDPDTPLVLVNKWGPIPGFAGYEITAGDWTAPGSSRRITLSDGSQATETITAYDRPSYFDYELTDFSAPVLRAALGRGYGQWWFSGRPDGGTDIVWTYSLEPRMAAFGPLVWLFVKTMYRAYVKAAVTAMTTISEREGLAVKSRDE